MRLIPAVMQTLLMIRSRVSTLAVGLLVLACTGDEESEALGEPNSTSGDTATTAADVGGGSTTHDDATTTTTTSTSDSGTTDEDTDEPSSTGEEIEDTDTDTEGVIEDLCEHCFETSCADEYEACMEDPDECGCFTDCFRQSIGLYTCTATCSPIEFPKNTTLLFFDCASMNCQGACLD
jgi:hypothetical protein